MEWIPVTERLPKPNTLTLLTLRTRCGTLFIAISFYDKDGWSAESEIFEIIAWMPAPEPYKNNKKSPDRGNDQSA